MSSCYQYSDAVHTWTLLCSAVLHPWLGTGTEYPRWILSLSLLRKGHCIGNGIDTTRLMCLPFLVCLSSGSGSGSAPPTQPMAAPQVCLRPPTPMKSKEPDRVCWGSLPLPLPLIHHPQTRHSSPCVRHGHSYLRLSKSCRRLHGPWLSRVAVKIKIASGPCDRPSKTSERQSDGVWTGHHSGNSPAAAESNHGNTVNTNTTR
jgi:hypothetical protein